ncbi:hypothetical protein PHYBOEH_004250 [Phytophthora boehmeriae]|uniref:Uncharacterized protein n=1 Tax=Phytophthora boehmeriae TaxID=109152 RepID=A0A8T1WS10_9STRA|nr:hypothetical protein PHYBOEH_004250 [Phytophthora boehmeriae]
MGLMARFFAYATIVVALVTRMVSKILSMSAARIAALRKRLLGGSHVEISDGKKQLLDTGKEEDAAQKELASEWVALPEEETWEPGARDLLDDLLPTSKEPQASETEDELVELSDGEDKAAPRILRSGLKSGNI